MRKYKNICTHCQTSFKTQILILTIQCPKSIDWNDIKFKDELKTIPTHNMECKLWNRLRNSSRYIATQHKVDPKDPKNIIVEQVLDTGKPASRIRSRRSL
jgi:hypothetical protein